MLCSLLWTEWHKGCTTRLFYLLEKMKSHDQAWEPCFSIEEKLKVCQNDRYSQLELQDDFSRVEHTMCFVEADTLSASWQKRRLAMRICMHEVIIHISTCSTSSWQQHLLWGRNLVLSFFAFCFPQRPSGLASEIYHMRKFFLKERFKNRTSYSQRMIHTDTKYWCKI